MVPRWSCLGCLDVESGQLFSVVDAHIRRGPRKEKATYLKPRGKSEYGRVRARQELHSQCSGFQWPICRRHRRMALPDCTNGLSPTALFNFPANGDLSPLLVQERGRVEDFHAGLRCHAKKKKEGLSHWPLTTSRPFSFDLWQMQSRRDMTSVRWSTKELLRPDGALLPLTSRIKFSPPLVLKANFLPRHSLS